MTYKDSNIFFKKDLFTHVSNQASFINQADHGIVIPKGEYEITIEYEIPGKVLESYDGKNASIKNAIKATLDKKLKGDLNESICFDVIGRYIQSPTTNIPSNPVVITDRNSKGLEVKLEVENSTYFIGDKIKGRVFLKR